MGDDRPRSTVFIRSPTKVPANLPGRSLQTKPGLFPYERVHFSQGTQIAGELVSRFCQVHTG